MSFLNTLIGYAKRFFAWEYWPYVIAILALVSLIIIIIIFIRKHRKDKGEEKEAKKESEEKKKPKGMPSSSLTRIWKDFLKEIPWAVRPAVMVYEHFIVFGESSAGKSALIDNYTDWQGHARQFYPSYTTNPLLQIYLGTKVLVQEIPASLLNDTSEYARRAFLKLWKRLFKRKDPTVVVVLNSVALQTDEPEYLEYLKQKAQIIRGKINLLSRIRKKPIKVRIALTHMDQIDGFLEYSQFLIQNNIPFKLEFSSKDDLVNISGCLEPYEEHLTRALTSLPADDYLKAITFLRQTPKLFQPLSVFVKFLQNPDPLSREPEVTGLYLTSQTEEKVPVLNPFVPSLTTKEIREFDPLFKHRVAAAVISIAGIIYFGASYLFERNLVNERYREMAMLEFSPPVRYDHKLHRLLPSVYREQHPLVRLLPDFFTQANREITRRCVENIRKFYLLPALERFSAAAKAEGTVSSMSTIDSREQKYNRKVEDTQDKVLYLLGLMYATEDNELGKLVHSNLTSWSGILDMPVTLIEDYVNNNTSFWSVSLDEKKLNYRHSKGIADVPREWMVYFNEIYGFVQQQVLTKVDYEKLQKETNYFLGIIRQLELYDLSAQIAELLKKESLTGIDFEVIAKQDSQLRQEPLKNFLNFIKNSNLSYPEVTDDLRLPALYENLKIIANFKGYEGDKDLQFNFLFGGQEFKFSALQWNDLMNRSRITLFLRDFISRHKRHEGLLFFSSDREFDDLIMNPSNDGRFLFMGRARVDGRFTKDAIEKRIKPIVTELPVFIENLAITQKDKSAFSNLLFKEVETYGRRYAQYYRKYYMEFDIKAASPGALRYVLSQMVLPSSPLMEVLLTIRDNTQIDPGKNPYLIALMQKLAEFDFIKRLMSEQKGAFTELDKYKALLDQMQMDMQEQAPVAKKEKDETITILKDKLTPLGRISVAIYRGEQDSYLNLVKLWLNSVGVPVQWQDIFLAPIWQAYFLGMTEVETDIGKIWSELRQSDIYPLYNKFPFEITSSEDISIEALKNATSPTGHFWQSFQKMLAPFCIEGSGSWRRRAGPFDYPKLPTNMLSTINTMAKLSSLLWDKDGKDRPFEFMIKPSPLPQARPSEPIAVLSYLNAGESSVLGFNQQPSWKKLKINWQNQSKASVGVEFTTRDRTSRVKRSIEVPNSNWSFYHLLLKTEEYAAASKFFDSSRGAKSAWIFSGDSRSSKAPRTMTWIIDSPASSEMVKKVLPMPGREVEGRPLEIKFTIQGDPWSLFRLSR
ncbi:MAG: hypothetical protein ABFD82_05025 [Syntrophaceae bacterium]